LLKNKRFRRVLPNRDGAVILPMDLKDYLSAFQILMLTGARRGAIVREKQIFTLYLCVGLRSQGCGFESLLAYKANFNIFNTKASNFGGLCCLHEWTNVDKKGSRAKKVIR